MSENKQALQVAALKNGTVIDHIPSEKRHYQNRRQVFLRRRNQPHIGSSTLRKTEHYPRL